MRGWVLLLGDMNAHSTSWNPHCVRRQNAGPLEELIDKYELIFNNNTDFPTRPQSPRISIIDLALTTAALGPLTLWEIPEEYPLVSDHELILLQWADLNQGHPEPGINTGWNIQALLKDKALFGTAKQDWEKESSLRPHLSHVSSKMELDSEVEWFEVTLGIWLDKFAKVTRLTSYSKKWWNDEVVQARKTWAKEKRRLRGCLNSNKELKKVRNAYYHIIRKAKRQCWQDFLQGEKENMEVQSLDKNRCWTALKYPKPQQFKTTPALRDPSGNIAISMKDKKVMVQRTAFPPPPQSTLREPRISAGTAHTIITKELVQKALIAQSTQKATGPDKIKFGILRLIWNWEAERMTQMVQQAI